MHNCKKSSNFARFFIQELVFIVFSEVNLITVILVILLIMGSSDLLTEPYPKIQKTVYHFAFLTTFFLFTIKYYYGPDINSYVPYYNEIPTLSYIFAHLDSNADNLRFEVGYNIFCSILRHAGLSYYWMTVVISVIYFGSLYLFFNQINRKQSMALMILVVLDYKLIFATFRQCLSVSFFMLMILLLDKKKYGAAIIMAIIAISFHKSAIFVVALTLFFYIIKGKELKSSVYQLLFVMLLFVLIIPLAKISPVLINSLPLPQSYIDSIIHHISLGKQFQTIFVVYAMTILCLAHYSQFEKNTFNTLALVSIVALCVIITLYQYYYLLMRIRSFFLPILIVYVFGFVQNAEDNKVPVPYGSLLKQLTSVIIIVYLAHSTYTFDKNSKLFHNDIYASCTVFDVMNNKHDQKVIQERQIKLADKWWEEDFMSNDDNKVDGNR